MTRTRTALITGATRGIGLAVAQRLAGEGFALTLSARDAQALRALGETLGATHGIETVTVAADLSAPGTAARLVDAHRSAFGSLDVLVLNAGAGALTPLEATTRDQAEALITLNAMTCLELTSTALPLMRAAVADSELGAKVIALSSLTGVFPQRKMAAYAASKAALRSIVESINLEHSHEGISATAVCPGYVATDMTSWLFDRVPESTMLSVDDVSDVISMLAGQSRRVVINEIVMGRAGTDGRTP